MKTRITITTIALLLIASACVTINVYFPEAAAEQAATTLITDVLGEQVDDNAAEEPVIDSNSDSQSGGFGGWDPLRWLIPAAYGQDVNIDINTPPVRTIRDRMRARQQNQLQPFFSSGAIGFTNDGLIEIRDRSAVSLAQRNRLNQLVSAENNDRQAIYREIAVANGHPEWEASIRSTFARRWVELAPNGWYYRDNAGNWQQK